MSGGNVGASFVEVTSMDATVTEEMLNELEAALRREERSEGTIEKYLRDVRQFAGWLGGRPFTREEVAGWKAALADGGCAAATVNVKLAAVNALLRNIGRDDCRVRFMKVQRRVFRDASRDLGREEYLSLVRTAYDQGKERLGLAMETICASGMRVSELRAITVEAVRSGQVEIRCKGKQRVVLLPRKLSLKLRDYARRQGIWSGPIFITSTGKPLSRRQIWGEMKALCKAAGVLAAKAFPHNLRHLFAVEYYRANHDIVKLADLLGHSSVETTRIYLIETGAEHQRHLDSMGLVVWPSGVFGAMRAW